MTLVIDEVFFSFWFKSRHQKKLWISYNFRRVTSFVLFFFIHTTIKTSSSVDIPLINFYVISSFVSSPSHSHFIQVQMRSYRFSSIGRVEEEGKEFSVFGRRKKRCKLISYSYSMERDSKSTLIDGLLRMWKWQTYFLIAMPFLGPSEKTFVSSQEDIQSFYSFF